ncbi:MAG: phospho-N-acetylmuramoyl-pentapeptide-transferase [Nitrospirae bacterium RIFCSPLOWO2_02_42_7]|nr:MAG: phospho-N-acetylmuramoyl-pentapeptide-transferase [Nitrospirae bacterium RIFCSPLOWO2_02_42_7]OGW55733.1 MAG: phospho-N-acetylmuramoyl-pentapeptide-transferase [Nitrospirae bacterium RIFCSPHIGHO2_02_FULL_42_12]
MIYYLLYSLHEYHSFFNVFRYITLRTVYAVLTALILCLIIGPYMIESLKRYQIGQYVRNDGPKHHLSKAGTPTMGGLLIIMVVLIATLSWIDLSNVYAWLVLLALVGFGAIGFIDDYLKVVKKKSDGLAGRYKFSLQIIVASIIAGILYYLPVYSTQLSVPFFKNFNPDLGWFYIIFVIFIIVGASNAVNLTDGLDGLAIGPTIVAVMVYTVITYVSGHAKIADYLLIPFINGSGELAILCGSVFGASLGFLWFNTYPASVFMGDVGSLPLGALLGAVAVISKHELLLVIVGGIFVVETVSVIFQVLSYKINRKRVFLMAPLHHHYELKGWQEPKIIVRFWIIAIILGLVALSTLKLR